MRKSGTSSNCCIAKRPFKNKNSIVASPKWLAAGNCVSIRLFTYLTRFTVERKKKYFENFECHFLQCIIFYIQIFYIKNTNFGLFCPIQSYYLRSQSKHGREQRMVFTLNAKASLDFSKRKLSFAKKKKNLSIFCVIIINFSSLCVCVCVCPINIAGIEWNLSSLHDIIFLRAKLLNAIYLKKKVFSCLLPMHLRDYSKKFPFNVWILCETDFAEFPNDLYVFLLKMTREKRNSKEMYG